MEFETIFNSAKEAFLKQFSKAFAIDSNDIK